MAGKDKAREERLAAALRDNLRRRKAHARQLAEQPQRDGDRDGNGDGDSN